MWQLFVAQVYRHHFSYSICPLCVSVSHFGNSHILSNFFIIVNLLWWCTRSDLWCHHWNCFRVMTHCADITNLINKYYMHSDCSTDQLFLQLSPSSCLPISWCTILRLGQIIVLQCPQIVQVKGRVTGLTYKPKARNDYA